MGIIASKVRNFLLSPYGKTELPNYPDDGSQACDDLQTPSQIKTGLKHNRKYLIKTGDKEETLAYVSIDPRSPTLEFERTPIILPSETGESTKKRLQVDSVNYGSSFKRSNINGHHNCVETPGLTTLRKKLFNMFSDVTHILSKEETLDASTATENATESDLLLEHCDKSTLLTTFHYEKGNEEYNDAKGQETRDVHKYKDELKQNSHLKIFDQVPRSVSTGIERTTIVVPVKEQLNKESMEEKFDDNKISPVAGLPPTVTKKIPKELSIYEDVSTSTLYDTPKKLIVANESVSRAPLSCMKNKAEILYDPNSQIPNKMFKSLSYIPRLKLRSKKTKAMPKSDSALKIVNKASVLSSDCENTPPNSRL